MSVEKNPTVKSEIPVEWLTTLARIDERTVSIKESIDKHGEEAKELARRVSKIENALADRDKLKAEFFELKDDVGRLSGTVSTIVTTSAVNHSWLASVWETIKTPASVLIGFLILSYAQSHIEQKAPRDPVPVVQTAAR